MAELSPNLGLNLPVGSDRFDYDKFLRQNFQILDDKVGKSTTEVLTATEGQTVFTLSNPYALGTDSLSVEVDGVKQLIGSGYTETSTTSITLSEPLVAGAKVKVVILGLDQGQDNRFDQIETSLAESAKKTLEVAVMEFQSQITNGDITVAFQSAIDKVIQNGGGVVLLPITNIVPYAKLFMDGTVYVNPTSQIPITIKGIVSNLRDNDTGTDNKGTTIAKRTTGDCIRVNLNSTGNCVLPATSQYFGFAIEGINFTSDTGTLTGVTAIKAFRTRGSYKNLSMVRIDKLIDQPSADASSNDNYCDMSIYENLRIVQSRLSGIELYKADACSIRNVYFENPNATAKYCLVINQGGGITMSNVLSAMSDNHATIAGGSIFRLLNLTGIVINGVYLESIKFESGFDIFYCSGVEISGIHERFYSNDMFKITNSPHVKIKNFDSWSNKNAGFYDINFVGSNLSNYDITFEGFDLKSYPDKTKRNTLINGFGNTSFAYGQSYHVQVYYDGANWKIKDTKGSDVSALLGTPVWSTDGISFPAPLNDPTSVIISPHYVAGVGPSYIPAVSVYNPLKIFFVDYAGTRITTQDNKMNFDMIIRTK